MKEFSLIIFDELHNARGDAPYNRLLELYRYEKMDNPDEEHLLPQVCFYITISYWFLADQ